MAEHRVFVYGTLKRGQSNHDQMHGATFLDAASTLPGHTLYDLGDYPGLVLDPAAPSGVEGELWRVDDQLLARLDAFEGVAEGLYARVPATLAPPHHQLAPPAWLYLYLGRVSAQRHLGPRWPA